MVQLADFAVLSLVTAVFYGLDPILSKRALNEGGTWLQSTLILLGIRVVLFWTALLALSGFDGAFAGVTPVAAALFAAGSLSATAFGRPALYVGIDRVGSTVSNAFVNARPLVAVVLGATLLGEVITPGLLVGVLAIVTGLVAVTLSRGGDVSGWDMTDLVFPLITVLAYSVGNVIRRFGFTTTPTTVLQAVTIGETVTLVVMGGYALASADPVWTGDRRIYGYFFGGNLLASLGFLSMFGALKAGPVSVVEPIVGAAPLVTIAVAAVFLRDLERITMRLLAGVSLVVVGIVLVTARPF